MTANVILPQAGATRITRIVKEDTPEVYPGSPTWEILRNTGGAGVVPNAETVTSAELSGSTALGIRDIVRTTLLGQADYNYEFSHGTPFEILLESLLQNDFGLNADGTSSGNADQLVPGVKEVTFAIEDDFSDIKESLSIRGSKTTNFNFSVQAGQIVTGTSTIQATLFSNNTDTEISDPTVSFVASTSIMTVSVALPSNIAVGNYIQVEDSVAGNDGYYEILVIASLDITLGGTLIDEGPIAATLTYQGESQFDATGATANTVASTEAFKAGNDITAEFSFDSGSTWVDTLSRGLRFPQADVTINTESNALSEITETQPFAILSVNRTIEIALTYYLINVYPIEQLLADAEFGLRFKLTDTAGNFYMFTFPRVKSASANAGEATLGSEMSGTWSLQALLDTSDENIIVDRL